MSYGDQEIKKRPLRTHSTVWVSQYTYRWAQYQWPDRQVSIDTYLSDNMIRITYPGYLHDKKLKKLIRIDDETFKRQSKRAEISIRDKRYPLRVRPKLGAR